MDDVTEGEDQVHPVLQPPEARDEKDVEMKISRVGGNKPAFVFIQGGVAQCSRNGRGGNGRSCKAVCQTLV
ncbi:hypothetical protein PFLUV_G00052210 [Perca fluviatilis]|uniref:Uncharacterized protein n=1 Tax=Perca fluviatilis TaxID=8168 RepID=A0A6A5FDU1_PERFL|nr:hypothetical protein PFLUV_G00052210 [Perca fluviatilis]